MNSSTFRQQINARDFRNACQSMRNWLYLKADDLSLVEFKTVEAMIEATDRLRETLADVRSARIEHGRILNGDE